MRGWLLSSQRQFDFWPPFYFGGCPLTFILTEEEDRSTEYIGVPPPCEYINYIIQQIHAPLVNRLTGILFCSVTGYDTAASFIALAPIVAPIIEVFKLL